MREPPDPGSSLTTMLHQPHVCSQCAHTRLATRMGPALHRRVHRQNLRTPKDARVREAVGREGTAGVLARSDPLSTRAPIRNSNPIGVDYAELEAGQQLPFVGIPAPVALVDRDYALDRFVEDVGWLIAPDAIAGRPVTHQGPITQSQGPFLLMYSLSLTGANGFTPPGVGI